MINFINYYAFLGLIALPIIFYIIKLYPPTPKKTNFSSLFLLNKLNKTSTSKTNFPIWLLIYRIIFLIFIILFFSKPFLSNEKKHSDESKKYVVVADIGWSMAKNWDKFKKIILEIGIEAEKNNKSIVFFLSNIKDYEEPITFQSSSDLQLYLEKLKPVPLQFRKSNLQKLLIANNFFKESKTFFLFSKYDFVNYNDHLKPIKMYKENLSDSYIIDPSNNIIILQSVKTLKNKLKINTKRFGDKTLKYDFILKVTSHTNEVIFKNSYFFNTNENKIEINIELPREIINQIKKIEIIEEKHAGATFYFDDFSRKKNIGILTENKLYQENPLLSSVYYIKKALDNNHNLVLGKLDNIISNKNSVIIMPDKGIMSDKTLNKIKEWLEKGGTLIRFSGPKIVKSKFNLYFNNETIPSIRLHGGELNIDRKLSLAPFDKESIFKGLTPPKDLVFKSQLIINSQPDIKVLAYLNDNTPLITLKNIGNGKIILYHITANNNWSNLPMSSIFSDMLERVLFLANKNIVGSFNTVSLVKNITAFGDLEKSQNVILIDDSYNLKNKIPSLNSPPGVYENKNISISLNLSNKIDDTYFFSKNIKGLEIKDRFVSDITDLTPILLKIILIMFIFDIIISVIIKNNIRKFSDLISRNKNFTLVLFLIFFLNTSLLFAKNLYTETHLAYVKISNEEINQISENGLNTIKNLLIARTSISPESVIGVNINKDEIFYLPFLYWPLTKNLIQINTNIQKKVSNYLNNGGIIFFDIIGYGRDNFNINDTKYKNIQKFLAQLEAVNLSQIPINHTLTKSFYLLKKFPGRWDNKIMLIENNNLELKDGVSSIILGFNNWASAWALDENNIPLFPVVPGGDRQRELAYRFGINLAMYALTGNYKSDQIHSKSILDRLNKTN